MKPNQLFLIPQTHPFTKFHVNRLTAFELSCLETNQPTTDKLKLKHNHIGGCEYGLRVTSYQCWAMVYATYIHITVHFPSSQLLLIRLAPINR